jgi:hypothetical protein
MKVLGNILFLLFLYLLLTLKPNADETGEKTQKIFSTCVLESHFTSISGLVGSIFSRKVHIVVPLSKYVEELSLSANPWGNSSFSPDKCGHFLEQIRDLSAFQISRNTLYCIVF